MGGPDQCFEKPDQHTHWQTLCPLVTLRKMPGGGRQILFYKENIYTCKQGTSWYAIWMFFGKAWKHSLNLRAFARSIPAVVSSSSTSSFTFSCHKQSMQKQQWQWSKARKAHEKQPNSSTLLLWEPKVAMPKCTPCPHEHRWIVMWPWYLKILSCLQNAILPGSHPCVHVVTWPVSVLWLVFSHGSSWPFATHPWHLFVVLTIQEMGHVMLKDDADVQISHFKGVQIMCRNSAFSQNMNMFLFTFGSY